MSILLEALRKTEKNQNARKAPTIHSDDQSGTVSEPLQTGPLVLLLVVALFVSGWFVWRQYQPPAGSYKPPVTLAPDRAREVKQAPTKDRESGQDAPPSSPVANLPTTQNRTPVESYSAPDNSVPRKTSAPAAARVTDRSSTVADRTENTSATRSAQAGAGESESLNQNVADEKLIQPEPEQYHPGEPEPISYWELPDAIRANVPEIRFSVLVYAADPEDRFVLINGERLVQGDSVQPGLVVKEIRREGVVFSYRLYQFLVER